MKTIQYKSSDGDRKYVSLDVYGGVRKPVLFYAHGGGWQTGDKGNNISDKVAFSQKLGLTFVSTNYRLVPSVKYSDFNKDVADAITWVLGRTDAPVCLMGHSSGGTIISTIATDPRYLHDRTRIKGVITLDADGYNITKQVEAGKQIYIDAFGTDPNVTKEASPITYVTTGNSIPPFLIFTRGTKQHVRDAADFASALQQVKIPARLVEAKRLTHAGVNDAVGNPSDKIITPVIAEFLGGMRS